MNRSHRFGLLTLVGILLGAALSYAQTAPLAAAHATNQPSAIPRAAGSGGGGGPEPSPCMSGATIQLTASPTTVALGQSSAVQWNVALPTGCGAVQVKFNGAVVGKNGSHAVTPPRTSSFNLTLSQTYLGSFNQRSASVQVAVTYPPRVVIDPSTPSPVRVLLGALLDSTNDQQVVELCNVDLDLTGITGITLGDHRSLIASPACARGPRSFGPRIFVRDARGRAPLFVIRGDDVLISGFRLEGPTSYMAQGDRKEKGIVVWPFAGREPIHDVEISNMEIFHWSGLGIQVNDNVDPMERGRLFNTNPNAVRVYGNYFHHNRHGAGEGYGVESSSGAYVTIEQNVFDENRHAIAGGSRNQDALDYSGYTVRDNLILEGGGLHCADSTVGGAVIGGIVGGIIGGLIGLAAGGPWGALIGLAIGLVGGAVGGGVAGGWCWQTHQIDMHGDENRWYSSSNWQCGTAGETLLIERNTILYTKGPAIKIRGNPADKAVASNNVFSRSSGGIEQNGFCGVGDNITKPIVKTNNVYGAKPKAQLGSCDFFGDGKQDQFMATGVTWWAKSPVTQQWRYLNTMTETLPQLQLTKVDNDNICDVAPKMANPDARPNKYSKGGTTPWIPLGMVVQ